MSILSKEQITKYRKKIQAALDKVAQEEGFESITLGNISYDELGFKSKVEATFKKDEKLNKVAEEKIAIQLFYLGLSKDLASNNFEIMGKTFEKISEVKRKNVIAKCVDDGVMYKIPVEALKFYNA